MVQCVVKCMEAQFDACVRDRCLILARMQVLWNAMLTLSSTPLSAGSCTFVSASGASGSASGVAASGGAGQTGGSTDY